MPLKFRVPGSSLLRRSISKDCRSLKEDEGGIDDIATEGEGGSTRVHVPPLSGNAGGRSHTPNRRKSTFRFTVPENAVPGQCIRIQGPDGRRVDITLPATCKPGKQLWVQTEESDEATVAGFFPGGSEALKELEESVRATADATRASCDTLRQRLEDELQVQRALWTSGGEGPMTANLLQQLISNAFSGFGAGGPLACSGGEPLSQTQALVFAAADAGDCKQLLAALAEARKFSTVSTSLEEAAKNLSAAEEAMVTWQCLLDALQVRDCREMEAWLEQARGLGLEVPADVHAVVGELRRQKDVEQRLQFALEACDPELLAEVTAEAEWMGLGETALAREAAARMCALASGRCGRSPSPGTCGRSGSIRHPSPGRDGGLGGSGGARAAGSGCGVTAAPPTAGGGMVHERSKSQWEAALGSLYAAQASAASQGAEAAAAAGMRQQGSGLSTAAPGTTGATAPMRPVPPPLGATQPLSMGPQDPSTDSPFGVKGGSPTGAGSAAFQRWHDANSWRTQRQPFPQFAGPSARSQQHSPRPAPAPSAQRPRQPPQQQSAPVDEPMEALEGRPSRELLEECRRLCLNTTGCTEREDLIRLLREHRERRARDLAQSAAGPAPLRTSSKQGPGTLRQSSSGPVAADQGTASTVWERRKPPARLVSRRSQALFLLGLETGPGKRATHTELRAAYRRAAMESHPDRIQNHTRQEEAKDLFQKVKEAFDYLSSPAGGVLS